MFKLTIDAIRVTGHGITGHSFHHIQTLRTKVERAAGKLFYTR